MKRASLHLIAKILEKASIAILFIFIMPPMFVVGCIGLFLEKTLEAVYFKNTVWGR
jgi:hypothetical protein